MTDQEVQNIYKESVFIHDTKNILESRLALMNADFTWTMSSRGIKFYIGLENDIRSIIEKLDKVQK